MSESERVHKPLRSSPQERLAQRKGREEEIDAYFNACFDTTAGQKVLAYLQGQTLHHVPQLGSPIEILADHNGQCRIVAECMARSKRGKKVR